MKQEYQAFIVSKDTLRLPIYKTSLIEIELYSDDMCIRRFQYQDIKNIFHQQEKEPEQTD